MATEKRILSGSIELDYFVLNTLANPQFYTGALLERLFEYLSQEICISRDELTESLNRLTCREDLIIRFKNENGEFKTFIWPRL